MTWISRRRIPVARAAGSKLVAAESSNRSAVTCLAYKARGATLGFAD